MDRPVLEVTWTDPVTGRRGYLVIDSLVRGLASGGLRMRDGCNLAEVRGLARAMALKEALAYDPADRYVPFGGAKGGLDTPPEDPVSPAVLRRFLGDVLPFLRERWCTGEDLGVRQRDLDPVFAELGLPTTVEPAFARIDDQEAARKRLAEGLAVTVDGVPLADLVGGYGVAEAAIGYAARRGHPPADLTAAVQGFGSIGGAAARYLAGAGVRVVAVSDRDGLVASDAGLDVERLLATRDGMGRMDRGALRADDRTGPREAWTTVPADILVPAAMSHAITASDVPRIGARFVVEGANLPVLPDAAELLARRGIPVLPDFLANLATNAWWWWVLHGDVEPTAEAAFAKISRTMRRLVDTVAADAENTGETLRSAALRLAEANLRRVTALTAPPYP